MLSDRTKVVRGVMAFLIGCAVLGLFMGLRGAMPGAVDPDYDSDAPLSTPSGVVVEAAPVQENLLVATNEMATNEPEEEEETEEVAPAPEPSAPEPPAPPAPKEEAPPADPVGDIIQPPTPAPPDIY